MNNTRGIVLGTFHGKTLHDTGPGHVLLVAPSRSGKGVGIVIPTLLTITDSVIVHDMKGENFAITAAWRGREEEKFNRVIRFDPTSTTSDHYNPLAEVRLGINEVRDAQNVADMLVDPDGSRERRDHWEKTGHSLLTAGILYLLYTQTNPTLADLAQLLSHPHVTFKETLEEMLQCTHEVVMSLARELTNKTPNELSGVLSTAMSFLALYRDPVIARATSASDFTIDDLTGAQKPVSLYLIIPPGDTYRTQPLIRLMLNQIGRRLTESLTAVQYPLLWVLDEFCALGRLEFIESSLSYWPGYRMRGLIVGQNLTQFDRIYGRDHSFLDMCTTKVFFAAPGHETQQRISKLLGEATVESPSRTRRREILELWHDQRFDRIGYTGRPLLTAAEIGQLSEKEALILKEGHPPIRAHKIRYYTQRHYRKRAA